MRVTFRKTSSRRYGVYVERDNAPALWIDPAPGFDESLPHDLLHFVAEAEWGLDGAIYGDLAAGGNARIFVPVDQRLVAKMWRQQRKQKHTLPDGRRSEQLASVLEYAWAAHRRNAKLPEYWRDRLAELRLDERQLERVLSMLDELAERWHGLAVGESITLAWPRPERRGRATAAARDKRAARPASAEGEARARARSAGRSTRAAGPAERAPRS